MHRLLSSTSRAALVVAATMLAAPMAARAQSFVIDAGTTVEETQEVSGSDLGEILLGGTLDTTESGDNAIDWVDAASASPGVSIVNDGIVRGGDRGIDTDGAVGGTFHLENNGSFSAVDDAFRIDDEDFAGSVFIDNTDFMGSDSGQVIDFDAIGGAARVEIDNSGDMISLDHDAIRLGSGTSIIRNSGTIDAQGEDRAAIKFDDEDHIDRLVEFNLVNDGYILASEDGIKIAETDPEDDPSYVSTSTAKIRITNNGEIHGGTGQAIDFGDLTSPDLDIVIVNHGKILSDEHDAIRPGNGALIENYGLIRSYEIAEEGHGIDFRGGDGTVINRTGGQIIGAKHGITGDGPAEDGLFTITNEEGAEIVGSNGAGLNFDTSMEPGSNVLVKVYNYGEIRGEATLLVDNNTLGEDNEDADGTPDADGDGVDVDGQVEIHNWGTIRGTGATGSNVEPNTADGIAVGGGLIRNYEGGLIEAYDLLGSGDADVGRAILIDNSSQGDAPFAAVIENAGRISSDGTAITIIGEQEDVIENWGVIETDAATAVFMGKGSDRFIFHAGSLVQGLVDGGVHDDSELNNDTDTIELVDEEGIIDLDQFVRFENLVSTEGSDFVATGANLDIEDVSVHGRLIVDAELANAAAVVADGGILGGDGVLGSIAVLEGGAVAPGNSIGTLTTGDLTFENGSFYDVEIDRTDSDLIVVDGGLATIDDGAVVRLSSDGGPLSAGTEYVIVEATQLEGGFRPEVEEDFLFLDATVDAVFSEVDNDQVVLTIERNGRSFASLGETRNQAAVGGALDRADGDEALVEHLLSATDGDAVRRSYDLLSGQVHASLGTVLFGQNTLVADTLIGRMRQAPAGSSAALAALGFGGPVTAYATKAPEPAAFNALKAPAAPAPGPVYAMWAQGFGQWSTADGSSNAAGVDGSLGGFLAGGDVTVNNFTFGLAGGYSSADVDMDDGLGSADADTAMIAAYGAVNLDAFRLRAGGSYGWSEIDSRRTAVVGNLVENPTASYDGSTANLFAEAAYAFEAGGVGFEPFAQIAWSRVETDGFTEQDAPITGLTSSGLSFDTTYTTLGARMATSFASAGGTFTPHVSLGWRHAFGDVTPQVAMAFLNTGTGFSVAGTPIAEDSLVVGAGLDFSIGASFSLNIGYEGQFGDEVEYNALKGGLTYRF